MVSNETSGDNVGANVGLKKFDHFKDIGRFVFFCANELAYPRVANFFCIIAVGEIASGCGKRCGNR